jgi:hypothetical protein
MAIREADAVGDPKASLRAKYQQDVERRAVEAMVEKAGDLGYNVGSIEYYGFHIARHDDEGCEVDISEVAIREMERAGKSATGYHHELALKPFVVPASVLAALESGMDEVPGLITDDASAADAFYDLIDGDRTLRNTRDGRMGGTQLTVYDANVVPDAHHVNPAIHPHSNNRSAKTSQQVLAPGMNQCPRCQCTADTCDMHSSILQHSWVMIKG